MKFKLYFPLIIFAVISTAVFLSARSYLKDRLVVEPTVKTLTSEPSSLPLSSSVKNEPSHKPAAEKQITRLFCQEASDFICQQPWKIADPTGPVTPDIDGEVRALRIMRNIVTKNPKLKIDQVEKKLIEEIYTPERRKKIFDSFTWAREEIITLIKNVDEKTLSSDDKIFLLKRLNQVKMELPPPASIYQDAKELYTKNAIYYERTAKGILRIRMGGAFVLNSDSWFNLIFSLAHELAHSIDPCELNDSGKKLKAFNQLTQCFFNKKWIESKNVSCKDNDRLSEVFADWIAAHVLGSALKKNPTYTLEEKQQATINAVRDLCAQVLVDETENFSAHHSQQIRIGEIYGNNPIIRKQLQCSQEVQYCDWFAQKEKNE
jgi:hypothetical protein